MRIHNIIKTVCLAGSLALLSACEDWLEIEPKDRFGDTTVWGSEENADMFLNDIYNQLPHLNNETQNLDQYSDNSYVGAEWMNARTTIYTGALSPTSWIPGPWDMWKWGRQNNDDAKGQYERIRSCNLFITKVTESDFSADYKKERLAEARFLRAWFYHYLWMAYGGVPIITEVLDNNAMQTSYDEYADLADVHGGPAVIETFGEKPFSPVSKPESWAFTEAQQKLQLELDNESGQITNRYIKGEERSFTIIAYPIPEIGEDFPEIFREIVKINTLDYKKYQKIQQTIIDTLDTCEWVEIKGKGENETDLLIHLHTLTDAKTQTNFENCVADVNIPLGEVFTSPVLAGTGGMLHVSKVYLNGLQFCDLKLVFDCGQVIDYSCSNFETEEENRKYIEDNILFHHPKLAMGEFAIGTNTTAYVAAQKYNIADKLPILIAEKMGPHFAVGDTCYSWSEDTPVYNPDGKEIIARDNEISEMRKEDVSLAYYGCHTDITIPYDELGSIRTIDDEGDMISIIEDGRFVLPGTEALNEPFGE